MRTEQPTAAEWLMEFDSMCRLNGDVIDCRKCSRQMHVARDGEVWRHAADCDSGVIHPWRWLRAILSETSAIPQADGTP